MTMFIGGTIKEREAREEKFRRDTLFTNLMTGQTVPSISNDDARFVLARLDAAPGDNKAVRERLEKQLAKSKKRINPLGPRSRRRSAPKTDGTENSPSVKKAVSQLETQFRGEITPEKAAFAAGSSIWFNSEAAQKEFKTRQAFQAAVGRAVEIKQKRSSRSKLQSKGRPSQRDFDRS